MTMFAFIKGCTTTAATALMYCNLANYDGSKVHEENGKSGQFAFECCSENLCNSGNEWPPLPDVPLLGKLHIFTRITQVSSNIEWCVSRSTVAERSNALLILYVVY